MFPGLIARVLHLMAGLLPDTASSPAPIAPGKELRPGLPDGVFGKLTALGRSAARRLNQAQG